jgi:hypothetical protein
VLGRRFLACSCALTASAAIALAGTAAGAQTRVVLGKTHLLTYGVGWGTARPRLIFNGGDPSGKAWQLTWSSWGAASAYAHGLTWISRPNGGGYYSKPGAIQLRASRIGRCTAHGPRAYTLQREWRYDPADASVSGSPGAAGKASAKAPSGLAIQGPFPNTGPGERLLSLSLRDWATRVNDQHPIHTDRMR